MSYWKYASFWQKIKDTIQILGTFTQLSLVFGDAQHIYNALTAAIQLLALLLPVWFEDKNRDGVVDLYQQPVITTVKVTAPGPADVEVKEEKLKTENE